MAHNALRVNNASTATLSNTTGSAATQGDILTYTAGAWGGAPPAPVNLAEAPAMYAGPKAPLTYTSTNNTYFNTSTNANRRVDVVTSTATHTLSTYNATIATAPAAGAVFNFRLRVAGYFFVHLTINPRNISATGYYCLLYLNVAFTHKIKIDNLGGEKNSATIQAIIYNPGDRNYNLGWFSGTGQRPHGAQASFISFSAVKIG